MARDYGKLFTRAWGDADFRALTGEAQGLYQQLISQPDMSMAGVITTAPPRWAGQSSNGTAKKVQASLQELERRRFIVSDKDTQETLVRSFIRNDLMWRSPKSMIGIDSSVRSVLSVKLKTEIAAELARCDTVTLSSKTSEATGRSTREVVEELIAGLVRDFPGTPSEAEIQTLDTPSDTPSEGVSDRGSRTSPTETATEPEPEPEPATEPATATRDGDTPSGSEFEQWWSHWRKKKAVGDARKAFPAARRLATLAELTAGADAYFAWVERNGIADQYVVAGGPWLRQERWEDELTDRVPDQQHRPNRDAASAEALVQAHFDMQAMGGTP